MVKEVTRLACKCSPRRPPPLGLSPQVAMVREVTKLVRELKQWSEGEPEAPTTARGPAGGRRGGHLHAQAAPMTALGPASGGVGTGGRYRCLDEPR